ncbi:peptide/nickel transport system permease protein [Mariprofundus ferrinatatus]|uniref:Peptide/nickel transport system permease protein n=1 Tax=Mariprofundus ferrinatatus TaxID=1921087 RepID=A0A2K8L1H9_9PROT|nr:ABC transporter permease [Mariprofundus ferrinatatus]ATX81158.1 peptide/nickel transport system permease protein [Mariprofundus ferrinatatus]
MDNAAVRLAGICLAFPLLVLLAALVTGLDGHAVDLDAVLNGMSGPHLLGTDALGRDVLARLSEGLQLSLMVGVLVVLFGGLVGVSVGMVAGWMGGWVDAVLMRVADIVLSFPGILLAIALAAMLGPGIDNLVMALVVVGWVGFARLARAQVLSFKSVPFVEAAIANGSGVVYIAIRHLLPNIAAPLLVEASFGLAAVIIGEAGLSFLGVGVQPPDASLGTMIREGTSLMLVSPGLVIWPGLVLFALVMAVNLLGDALRDKLDVRMELR